MEDLPYASQQNIITEYFVNYQKNPTEHRYTILYEAILEYAYNFPELLRKKNVEYGSEFMLYVQRKVPLLIQRFQFYGVAMEGYLYRTFKGQFMSFINTITSQEKHIKNFTTYDYYKILEIPTFTEEKKDMYSVVLMDDLSQIEIILNYFKECSKYNLKAARNRIWMYVVKYCPYFSNQKIFSISSLLGIPHIQVLHLLNQVDDIRTSKQNKRLAVLKKCETSYARYIQASQKLYEQKDFLNTKELSLLKDEVDKTQQMFRSTLRHYKRANYNIPNSVIAQIFNMSKGSVDSAMFHFKKICKEIPSIGKDENKDTLNNIGD